MKTIYTINPPSLTFADELAFEMLKAHAMSTPIASFVITPEELVLLQETIVVESFTDEDLKLIVEGTHFLGIPLIVTDATTESDMKGFEAAGKVVDRRHYN